MISKGFEYLFKLKFIKPIMNYILCKQYCISKMKVILGFYFFIYLQLSFDVIFLLHSKNKNCYENPTNIALGPEKCK